MTPLAAQLFRKTNSAKVRSMLSNAQFLECTAIFEMAAAMTQADHPGAEYSLSAMLPAPITCIEMVQESGRHMYFCSQVENQITYVCWMMSAAGTPVTCFASGFSLGTTINHAVSWRREELSADEPADAPVATALGTNNLIEKALCILNQQNLVDHNPRATDKRVLKMLPRSAAGALVTWHECRIRPGRHGQNTGNLSVDPLMPLHYVRKYFRPSSRKWIDGYWRGDASLGVHLKWYSAGADTKSPTATLPADGSVSEPAVDAF